MHRSWVNKPVQKADVSNDFLLIFYSLSQTNLAQKCSNLSRTWLLIFHLLELEEESFQRKFYLLKRNVSRHYIIKMRC